MTRNVRVRVAAFVLGAALIIGADFVVGPSSRVVEADIDKGSHRLIDFDLSSRDTFAIARNIVTGSSIIVCSDSDPATHDYPNTTTSAVAMWNGHLRGSTGFLATTPDREPFMSTDAFVTRGTCPDASQSSPGSISHVAVHGEDPTSPRYNDLYPCGEWADGSYAAGCFLIPPSIGHPGYTWFGELQVVLNSGEYQDTRNVKETVRIIAHELGHVLGLRDQYAIKKVGDAYIASCRELHDSLMDCEDTVMEADFDRFQAVYEPNVVEELVVGDQVIPIVRNVLNAPGTVSFEFDASKVNVEDAIQIRRWEGSVWGAVLQEFSYDNDRPSWTLGGQPTGTTQTYGVFSTTSALLEGQCRVYDPVCSKDHSETNPARLMGFGKIATVQIPAVSTANVPPVITNFSVSGRNLTGTFTWADSEPRYLTWELSRASSATDTYAPLSTMTDSVSGVTFTDQLAGYHYKLRGRACWTTDSAPPAPPTEHCGDWSAYAGPVEIPSETTGMPVFSITNAYYTFTVNTDVDQQLPQARGGDGRITYSINPALPDGLNLQGRFVRGTPTTVAPQTTHTLTATDSDHDSDTMTIYITIADSAGPPNPPGPPLPPRPCTLTVTAGVGGTASGSGSYACNTSQGASATANSDYQFSNWSGDSTSTSSSISVYLDGDKSVHANFRMCTLTVTEGTGGTAGGSGTFPCNTSQGASATANSGYEFSNWSGDSTSTSPSISVYLDGDKSVHANFDEIIEPMCTLTVTAGTGGSAGGSGTFPCNTSQGASATANSGYQFSNWSGDSTSTSPSISVYLDGDKSVHANFRMCTLTVTAGRGGSASGSGTFPCNTSQIASATVSIGYFFDGWSGDSTSSSRTISVYLDGDKSVHANYSARARYTLSTSVSPPYGTINVSPSGPYYEGYDTIVTVTVSPWYPSYYFSHWEGDCSDTHCSLTMNGDKSVTAVLEEDCDPNIGCTRTAGAGKPYTLTLTVNGAGIVTTAGPPTLPDPGAAFDVTLTASWSDATHEFSGWGGDCSGTASTCVLTIDGDKSVTAEITELPADRCTESADADCIRAVYRGAPGDYAQVTDIPLSALVTPTSDGGYEVGGGVQITVVTAAPLREGHERFHLGRSPAVAPSPVSEERLVLPVGTTYTFTPATAAADGTVVTFELTAGSAPEEGEEPEPGQVVVRTTFRVTVPPAPE